MKLFLILGIKAELCMLTMEKIKTGQFLNSTINTDRVLQAKLILEGIQKE
jgi:hypothetical protein